MDVSNPDEAFHQLYPHSTNEGYRQEYWSVIRHLELNDEWELQALTRKMPLRKPAFSIRWAGYSERTAFREITDRIFVIYDVHEETYTIVIPVLAEEQTYRDGEFVSLKKESFNRGEETAEHINELATKTRQYMIRNAFIETNHKRAIRVSYDPVSEQFVSGKEQSWSKDVDDGKARIYAGEREDVSQSIDRLVGYDGEKFEADGEQIDPDDPHSITTHSPKSIVDVHGIGRETEFDIGLTFGTYDNVASVSLSEVNSKVDTSNYYDPDLKEMRNKAISAIQTADRISAIRKEQSE